jgi:hypothetical protein
LVEKVLEVSIEETMLEVEEAVKKHQQVDEVNKN